MVGYECVLSQPGDGLGQVAHLGGEHPFAVAVAVIGTLAAALVPAGAGSGGDFCLQQVWKPVRTISGISAPVAVRQELVGSSKLALWERVIVCEHGGRWFSTAQRHRSTHQGTPC